MKKALTVTAGIYMTALFVIVPLIVKNKYEMIGTYKYQVFRGISLAGLAVLLLLLLLLAFQKRKEWKKWKHPVLSLTDKFVLAYLVCVVISFLLAGDKQAAWTGAQGWWMGLQSQLIFIAVYFVVSRLWEQKMYVLYAAGGTAFFVFVIGVLHRFSIDPLRMYEGFSDSIRSMYLSLLGQSSWYGSYVCTLFPLGLYFFWNGKKVLERIAGGIFGAAAFATMVTLNGDSSYIALGLVLLLFFVLGFEENERMERFLEVLILMLVTFQAVGLLQKLFPEKAVYVEHFSSYFTQSAAAGIMLIAVCCIYGLFLWFEKQGGDITNWMTVRNIGLLAVSLSAVLLLLFIVLNTMGYIHGKYAEPGVNNYLLFSEAWGNNRGRTWMYSADVIREMPWQRKLFGVGPDCFASYGYGIPEYAERLRAMWGNDTLTNAHNEWLNSIICYGFVGAAAYIGIYASAFFRFWKAKREKPLVTAAALCIVSYMGYNLFCYQQVLCTPFIFLIMGMGENLLRNGIRKD